MELLRLYAIKVGSERRDRLAGKIVGADFALRQLTYLELVLDCAGGAKEALLLWTGVGEPEDLAAIVPSDVVTDLAEARQAGWDEAADPPRPLFRHDPHRTRPTGLWCGPTTLDRGAAQAEAERHIGEAQAMWEAAATEDGWKAWRARQ